MNCDRVFAWLALSVHYIFPSHGYLYVSPPARSAQQLWFCNIFGSTCHFLYYCGCCCYRHSSQHDMLGQCHHYFNFHRDELHLATSICFFRRPFVPFSFYQHGISVGNNPTPPFGGWVSQLFQLSDTQIDRPKNLFRIPSFVPGKLHNGIAVRDVFTSSILLCLTILFPCYFFISSSFWNMYVFLLPILTVLVTSSMYNFPSDYSWDTHCFWNLPQVSIVKSLVSCWKDSS